MGSRRAGFRNRVAAAGDNGWFSPVVLVAVILTGLISAILSRPLMCSDEGNWAYQARVWIEHGWPPYSGSVNNKPPGILILNAVSYGFCGISAVVPRCLGALAIVGASVALYGLGRRLLSRPAGLTAMVIFGLGMSWESVDGFSAAHPESFVAFWEVLGLTCVVSALAVPRRRQRALRMLAAGAALGVATSFKQIAFLGVLGVVALYLDLRRHGRWNADPSALGRDLGSALAGFVIANIACAAPVLLAGAQPTDFFQCVFRNCFTPASWEVSPAVRAMRFFQAWWLSRFAFLWLLLILFVWRARRFRGSGFPVSGVLVWLLLDFVGANLGGCYYGHQLKQVLAPLALVAGVGLAALVEDLQPVPVLARRWVLGVLVCMALALAPWRSVGWTLTHHSTAVNSNRIVGQWLWQHTTDSDRVFALGGRAGAIMAHSGRLSPGRHFLTHFVLSGPDHVEFDRDFARHPPVYIAIPLDSTLNDPYIEFGDVVKKDYHYDSEVGDCSVYRRNEAGRVGGGSCEVGGAR